MTALRLLIYFAVLLPGLLFTLIYLYELRHLKATRETWIMLIFIADITVLGGEVGIRNTFYPGVPTNPWFFATTMLIAAACIWSLLYTLVRYQSLPRMQARRRRKRH